MDPPVELQHLLLVLRRLHFLLQLLRLRLLLLLLLRATDKEGEVGGVQHLRRLTTQERRGQRRHPGRRRLQSPWGGVQLVLRLPPRPRVLKDSWPHSGPGSLRSP